MDKHLNNTICYTDGSKLEKNLGAKLCYMYNNITGQKSWNLGTIMKVYDAELFAIAQALRWTLKENLQRTKDIWIFSDNQAAIKRIQKSRSEPEQHLALQCQQSLQTLVNADFTSHIHWVSEHEDIEGNELTDKAAKLDAKQTSTSDSELCQETN